MAIYVPGKRRNKRRREPPTKRNVVAALQLTAMVDMFTVLVVFLLQNYASTNQVLPIADQIDLPTATLVKELKPSLIVVLSKDALSFNDKQVGTFGDVVQSKEWLIPSLFKPVQAQIQKIETETKNDSQKSQQRIRHKMTLQVDKDIDFLSVKKVLYTLTEAGVQEINFAVIKVTEESKYHL